MECPFSETFKAGGGDGPACRGRLDQSPAEVPSAVLRWQEEHCFVTEWKWGPVSLSAADFGVC